MDQKETICIKKEETDQAFNELGSVVKVYPPGVKIKEKLEDSVNQEVKVYPPGVKIKEELEDSVNQEDCVKCEMEKNVVTSVLVPFISKEEPFLEDPVGVCWCTACINEKPELNFGWCETENNNSLNGLLDAILEAESECCPPPLLVSMKEVDCVKCEMEKKLVTADLVPFIPKQEPVVTSRKYESDSSRLSQNSSDNCCILYEEAVTQIVVHSELKTDSEQSTPFTVCDTHRPGLDEHEEEEILCVTRLKCNLREKEFNKFTCSFCLQSFPSKYRLIMHVFIHIDGVQPPVYVCKSCGEVFASNISLKKHLKISEGDKALNSANNKKFDCSDDNKNIILEGDLEDSVIEQSGKQSSFEEILKISDKSFVDICNTTTMTQDVEKLDRHPSYGTSSTSGNVNGHTVELAGKRIHKYDCCYESFTQLGNLKRHLLTHTGQRPHKCDTCGKRFTHMYHLKDHSLTHTGQRPHKCDICGKSFSRMYNLKDHLLTHTGQRPHKCAICGKSFTQISNLKSHSLTHTGQRPHKCYTCGKSFTHISTLKSHSLTHTGQRPHKCDICDKSFTRLGHLKRHAATHTGRKPNKSD